MRGTDGMQESLFVMAKLEDFVPSDHPLRAIQGLVDEALGKSALYSPSVACGREHALQTGTVDDRDMLMLHLDQPFLLEAGEQPAHGLELEPEVAADVLA